MAMGRFNRPSIMVYGGTIRAGCAVTQNNAPIDIISAFQSYGEFITNKIDEKTRFDVIRHACPGPGACGGMYTANTMASAAEAMGMTLPGGSSFPADSPEKLQECLDAGAAIRNLMEKDIKPRDIMTAPAFRNAITLTMALGGSTNAVLHLIAIARAVDIPLTIDDFQEISDKIPFIADMKPSGKYVMEDLHKIGGTQAVLKYLFSKGLIDGSTMTVTGKTLEENLSQAPDLSKNQDLIRPLEKPIKSTGHITILRGTLAPGGSVGKITGKEGTEFTGRAKVFHKIVLI
jgi:dihydroxy-acid dehydratase